MSAYIALVVGSTGAVGREVVAELVQSSKCGHVIALSRRDIPEDKWPQAFPSLDADAAKTKLEIRVVDFDDQKETDYHAHTTAAKKHPDAVFSCLGTTRQGEVL